MSEYLVFRLYAPLASWGGAAVGGARPSATCPGRSAILGLLGAALGVERNDEARQSALFSNLHVAIKQYRAGALLEDYHTVQVPAAKTKVRYRTRRDELNASTKTNTILSSRQYRSDGLWTVAVWCSRHAQYGVSELCDALRKPVFSLYLGRRSCPLAAPLAPEVVDCSTLQSALDHLFPDLIPEQHRWLGNDATSLYVWEGNAADLNGHGQGVESSTVWDNPLSRTRWQFGPRQAFRCYQEVGEPG